MVDASPAATSRVASPTSSSSPPQNSSRETKNAFASGIGMPSSLKKLTVFAKFSIFPEPVW